MRGCREMDECREFQGPFHNTKGCVGLVVKRINVD